MEQHHVELRMLGHTELSTVGGGTGSIVLRQPKRLALLAYLALATTDGYRRRDQIVALFWPDLDQTHARTQLRKVLHALRGTIGASAFASRGEEEIRLDREVVWCDAVEFRRLIDAEQWTDALALYRGDLLEGLFPGGVGPEFESWLSDQRGDLRATAARAAWQAFNQADLAGRRDEAVGLARSAVELNPDDEEGIRRLIAVLDRHGDRGGALRAFSEWEARLKAEYDAEPAPETRKLLRKVQAPRHGESAETPSLMPPVKPVAASVVATPPRDWQPTPAPARRSMIAVAIIAFAIITLVAAQQTLAGGSSDPSRDSAIAVLPFRALGDSVDAVIGEGMSDELTTALAQVRGLVVRASARSRRAAANAETFRDIGNDLAVSHIVEGSVRHDGARMRVLVRLIHVRDGRVVWVKLFDAAQADLIGAQEQIAREAVREIRMRIDTSAVARR